jgi:hypothetical protein
MGRVFRLGRPAVAALTALLASCLVACSSVVSGTPSAIGSLPGDAPTSFTAAVPTLGGCAPQSAPRGVSAEAVAYLRAANDAIVAWSRVDAALAAEHDIVHRNDLIAQVDADTPFASELIAITFSPAIEPIATRLIDLIEQYDGLLQMAYAHDGFYAAHHAEIGALDEARAEASAQLRSALGLPPSNCRFRRP